MFCIRISYEEGLKRGDGLADFVFRRKEQKYILNAEQAAIFRAAMAANMEHDRYATSDIRNIYYDTPDYRLIRRSLEKPEYKEKLRLRSYGDAAPDSEVFLEMKKKYKGVVYKRRIRLTAATAQAYMQDPAAKLESSQIGREIDYFKAFYRNLRPALFLSYDRESWKSHDGYLRITVDWNIRYRTDDLDLTLPNFGQLLLEEGVHLVEIKSSGAMPLWLAKTLSENQIRQRSFSKYGAAYTKLLAEDKLKIGGYSYARQ